MLEVVDIVEGRLTFSFPENMKAIKFDDTAFYRNRFLKVRNNIKAIDIIALDDKKVYFIEIKDYTHPDTKNIKPSDLIEAVINKVIFSLAAILPMKNTADIEIEKEMAKKVSTANEIKVIVHIELPPKRRTLSQSNFDLQAIEIKLRSKLRVIDPHLKITTKDKLLGLPWSVS